MADLDFGIHYSCQSPDGEWEKIYNATLGQVQEAESLGYTSISVAEHHFLPDGWVPSPTTLLGAIAGVTEELKIGTNIVILPLHHPVAVAEQAAILDLLSGGNFRLGVGIGWRQEEFDVFGVKKSDRVPRVEEGISLIDRLLQERSVTYSGEFYSVDDLDLTPRPVQDSVPIWYGGQSDAAIRRAATMAGAWSMSPIETREQLVPKVEEYNAALERAGRNPETVHRPLRREAYIAEDEETAWQEVGPSLLYEYQDVYGDYEDIDHTFDPEEGPDALEELRDHADERFIIGSPETAIRELSAYREAVGMDEVLLRMHFPGLDPRKSAKSMRIIADEVLPHFRN